MMVGSTTLNAQGTNDFFITKLDSTGSPLWAKSFGGSGDSYTNAIALDASGNTYSTGSFSGSITVGNTTLSSGGDTQVFIIKVDSSGSPVSAESFGNNYAVGYGIAVDPTGSPYTTGEFEGTMTVGSTTLTALADTSDVFMFKL